jgi:hypothetical protein
MFETFVRLSVLLEIAHRIRAGSSCVPWRLHGSEGKPAFPLAVQSHRLQSSYCQRCYQLDMSNHCSLSLDRQSSSFYWHASPGTHYSIGTVTAFFGLRSQYQVDQGNFGLFLFSSQFHSSSHSPILLQYVPRKPRYCFTFLASDLVSLSNTYPLRKGQSPSFCRS